jgi:hypothetical protein
MDKSIYIDVFGQVLEFNIQWLYFQFVWSLRSEIEMFLFISSSSCNSIITEFEGDLHLRVVIWDAITCDFINLRRHSSSIFIILSSARKQLVQLLHQKWLIDLFLTFLIFHIDRIYPASTLQRLLNLIFPTKLPRLLDPKLSAFVKDRTVRIIRSEAKKKKEAAYLIYSHTSERVFVTVLSYTSYAISLKINKYFRRLAGSSSWGLSTGMKM